MTDKNENLDELFLQFLEADQAQQAQNDIRLGDKILRDSSFDNLREEFLKVTLTSLNGQLPAELPFENIINSQKNDSKAVLTLQNISQQDLESKAKTINCQVETGPLPLEEIYKIVVTQKTEVEK